jgi:hypothetical protein
MELLPVSIVERWHNALNAQDFEMLCAVTAADVEVMSASGSRRGPAAFEEWLGFTAEPFRWFCGPPGLVVVEQVGCWSFPPTTMERVIASAFRVFNGRVVRYRRFDDLEPALAATSLTDDDEVLASGVTELFAAARPAAPATRPMTPDLRRDSPWLHDVVSANLAAHAILV